MPSRSVPFQSTILVVDDERMTLAIIARLLEQHGFRTLQANSAHAASQMIAANQIDLILLDVVMPEMDGWQLLTRLRECYDEIQLPVIMLTATDDRQEIIRMFELGANDYISKPFDPEVTLARVGMQLRLKSLQKAVRISEERYELAARATNDGLWDWDLTSNQVYYSPRWNRIVGREEIDVVDSPEIWWNRVHPDDQDRLSVTLTRYLNGESRHFDTEYRIRHEDQSYRWVMCRGVAVRNATGENIRMAGSLTDITGGKVVDVLTGLPNRLLLTDRIKRCFEEFQRDPTQMHAVLYLDLDNFKYINDTFGHESGDRVLMETARRLESVIQSIDAVAARFGGDEFAVLLESIPNEEFLRDVAARIHDALSAPIAINNGRDVFTRTSVGIAMMTPDMECFDDILRHADIAMYDAKSNGKSRTSLFDQSMRARSTERLDLETDLRKAVQRRDFTLHYQPIVEIETHRLVGFEALVRWEHPVRGTVFPAEFIPLAEEIGLIQPLGNWIITEACRQISRWKQAFPEKPELSVSVNISYRQLLDPDFAKNVLDAVDRYQLDGRSLKLELTESMLMQNLDRASGVLNLLRENGFRIGVDDFGTGFSSLSYLHHLPLDILKIDKSFVCRLNDADNGRAIVRTILSLASNLGLDVVAEGVETLEQAEELLGLGCQYAQGYYFSTPVTADAASLLIHQSMMDSDFRSIPSNSPPVAVVIE